MVSGCLWSTLPNPYIPPARFSSSQLLVAGTTKKVFHPDLLWLPAPVQFLQADCKTSSSNRDSNRNLNFGEHSDGSPKVRGDSEGDPKVRGDSEGDTKVMVTLI